MRVVITGGTGFIGSRLALRCLAEGHEVRVLGQENTPAEARNRAQLEAEGVEVQLGSVTDRKQVFSAIQGADWVFHLAAAQHEANVPDRHFWDVNVEGTRNVLEACVAAQVQRLVHGSTIGVYGSALAGPLDESSPVRPDNIYGRTKLEGERLVLSYRDRLPVVVIRISETYGPGDLRLLKLFKAIQKGAFFLIGDGQNLHHLIYVEDLVRGFLQAAASPETPGQVFVLAGKEVLTTREMVETIAQALGARVPSISVPLLPVLGAAVAMEAVLRPLGIQPPLHRRRMDFFRKSFHFSNRRATEVFGFNPEISFAEGVRRTIRWYVEQGYLPSGTAPSGGHHAPAQANGRAHSPTPASSEIPGPGAEEVDAQPYGRPAEALAISSQELAAQIEPFDSFWEGPEDVASGYARFGQFYRVNYLPRLPRDRDVRILVVSCGPGYFVNLLKEEGYTQVLGIDSDPAKVEHARQRGLNCRVARAFEFLQETAPESYDVIICEQELNHLTKREMVAFLHLCRRALAMDGMLVVHGLNGANPITGAEALAQNFDHFNTFTAYSLEQVLAYCGYDRISVFPLNLYVFYSNPFNYVAMAWAGLNALLFRLNFMLYGKHNKIFTKKIGAVCRRGL